MIADDGSSFSRRVDRRSRSGEGGRAREREVQEREGRVLRVEGFHCSSEEEEEEGAAAAAAVAASAAAAESGGAAGKSSDITGRGSWGVGLGHERWEWREDGKEEA